MIYAAAAIVAIVLAFIWWRWTSVARGTRERDAKLLKVLEPLEAKFIAKKEVTPDEIQALAVKPQFRPMLYSLLKYFERLDLFPKEYVNRESQAEGVLAYWLMHPNELQGAPDQVELVESVRRQVYGEECEFYVFKFKMPADHWAAKDGWLVGLAGPFVDSDVPYSGLPAGFSRFGDKYEQTDPKELIDWFIRTVGGKGAAG